MYPRWLYVGLLALATGGLQFAAAFGDSWMVTASFVTALGIGVVVFYQGEHRVTPGPIFANFAIAVAVGTVATTLLAAVLFIWILNVPWDIALWYAGLVTWETSVGIGFAMVTSFFVVGVVSAMQ